MSDESKTASQEPAPCACGPSCDCGPTAAGRSWLKGVIAAIILLAAVGVGAYSLVKKPVANGGQTAPAPATTPAKAGATAPSPAPATGRVPCCAGQAAPAPTAKPCCAGGAPPPAAAPEAAPKPSCCAGGGSPPAASTAQPSCGGQRPACCGGH